MTKFKIKNRYAKWLDKLMKKELVSVNNGIDGLALCRKVKQELNGELIIKSIRHNEFIMVNMSRRQIRKVDTNHKYTFYEI